MDLWEGHYRFVGGALRICGRGIIDWWERHYRLVGSGSIAFAVHTQRLVHIRMHIQTQK